MRSTILVLALTAVFTPAQSQRSIVGRWAETAAGCATNSEAAIIIAPLALNAAELSCTFKTVKREGATVIWTGQCAWGGAPEKQTTVKAQEINGRLTLTYSTGGGSKALQRCS